MKPMLAHRFADYNSKLGEMFYVQPKLNGVRALYKSGLFQSRDEKIWNPSVLAHIEAELSTIIPHNYILDGELYHHGWSLQKINGAIAVTRLRPDSPTTQVEYHIFDVIDTNNPSLPFSKRFDLLYDLQESIILKKLVKTKIVETSFCSLLAAESLYAYYKNKGYEGLMYRIPYAPYGFLQNCKNKENRWSYLLKRKDWLDEDFLIIDFSTTVGKKGFRGFQLTCVTETGLKFNVGSGLLSSEIDEYTINSPVGRRAKVRYEMLSDLGKPLKPTLEAIL